MFFVSSVLLLFEMILILFVLFCFENILFIYLFFVEENVLRCKAIALSVTCADCFIGIVESCL